MNEAQQYFDDGRNAKPSASKMPRIMSCQGSLPLEIALRERGIGLAPELIADEEDANRGTRIHDALEAQDFSRLAFDEVEDAESLQSNELRIFERIHGDTPVQTFREIRLWNASKEHADGCFSGRLDLYTIDHDEARAAIIDYKAGWKGPSAEGHANWQLRAQAVLVLTRHPGLGSIAAAINRPKTKPEVAVFTPGEVRQFEREIHGRLQAGYLAAAEPFRVPYEPGEHCRYCPVRLHCPALRWQIAGHGDGDVIEAGSALDRSRIDLVAATAERLDRLMTGFDQLKHLERAVQAEMIARLQNDPQSLPGWVYESSGGKREVSSSRDLAERLIEMGVSMTDVLDAISLPLGKAEALHKQATGLKGRAARSAFDEAVFDLVEHMPYKPSLHREKP